LREKVVSEPVGSSISRQAKREHPATEVVVDRGKKRISKIHDLEK